MKRLAGGLALVVTLGVIAFFGYRSLHPTTKLTPVTKVEPSETIVQFDNEEAKQQFQQQNNIANDQLRPIPGTNGYVVPKKSTEVTTVPGSASQPNYIYHALVTPNDPLHSSQWYPAKISAPTAWDTSTGSSSVTVAVLDTGFALSHEDMANRWATNSGEVGSGKETNGIDDDANGKIDDWRGWDFIHTDNTPNAGSVDVNGDAVYHGSWTSGLVGATGNNSKGVASINWGAKILPLQVLDDDGVGDTAQIAAAINYAVARGAKVISMSLGQTNADPTLRTAIDNAIAADVTIVAAAGNCGDPATWQLNNCDFQGQTVYPGNYPEVITVGATDTNDNRAPFSSYGANVDVVAPGYASGSNRIITTDWFSSNQTTAYTTSYNIGGTSIATPIVAGLAATLKGQISSATPVQIQQWLKDSADKVSGMSGADFSNFYGYGRINAYRSLNLYTYSAVSTTVDGSPYSAPASIDPGQTKSFVLTIKNTGTATWSNTTNPVRLANTAYRTSPFQAGSWTSQFRPATLTQASVAPGSNGSFSFDMTAPSTGGSYNEGFEVVADGATWFNITGLSFGIAVPTYTYSYQVISQQYSIGGGFTTGAGLSMTPAGSGQLKMVVKNTGTATWSNSGSFPVKLATSANRNDAFYTTGGSNPWLSSTRAATLQEASVAPNANGTFVFDITAPNTGGTYTEDFNLVAEGIAWFNIINPTWTINVQAPTYTYSLISRSVNGVSGNGTVSINPGQTKTLEVVIQNTGSATWSNSSFPIKIATTANRTSSFQASGWGSTTRPAVMTEASVAPGGTGTFTFDITGPAIAGIYTETFDFVAEGKTWLNITNLPFSITVNPLTYTYSISGQTVNGGAYTPGFTMGAGTTKTLALAVTNTGTATWSNSTAPVRLANSGYRVSPFYTGSWTSAFRPATLTEASVAPGQTGTFSFTATAPLIPGVYTETFDLVADGLTWFNITTFSFVITVN